MEPRSFRPKFFNPFTEVVKKTTCRPWCKGFFRAMPMHRWSLDQVEKVLELAAARPSLFGLPECTTCIVNTSHFLPSSRSRTAGVWVFGAERGCKSLVIPRSCNTEPFDSMDTKLIESLFRWNPGMEYLYLSKSCQPMTATLVPLLSRLKLQQVTLEGWNDAVAIHKIMMACKQLEVLDTYSYDEGKPNFTDELSAQAINTVVEMHPKLRAVEGSRNFLEQWFSITRFSRCKHNVALVPATCTFSLCYYVTFVCVAFGVSVVCYKTYLFILSKVPGLNLSLAVILSFILWIATFSFILADDYINRYQRGRVWMIAVRHAVLLRRRLTLAMGRKMR